MKNSVIVILQPRAYQALEEQARAAGATLSRHASELLEDLLEPPASGKKMPKHASMRVAEFLEPPVPKKKATNQAPPKPVQNKPPSKNAAPYLDLANQGKVLRGLAVHSPARRSEIAKKAAATRKRRAEEAAQAR